jgi:UDP-N-acetyl-D-glucosamine dehydrogenase
VTFAGKGVRVIGFEKSGDKAAAVTRGDSYVADVSGEELRAATSRHGLEATVDFSRIAECDAVIICVPTPLDKFRKPDMSFIEQACIDIGRSMRRGTLVSLESTTYPSTTEGVMLPILERESGMSAGRDFWLCYSPERVDPGNKVYRTANTPKVVGGMGPQAQELALALYGAAIEPLFPVSSPAVAEMVKILENTYRLVNISLINELALLCNRMSIDIWEVIEAARSKPYGFQAFYPGPGVGGHCIPLDPFYLEHIAKTFDFDLTMIHTAGQINTQMPHRMLVRISYALNKHKKAVNGSRVLFLGVAYKKDIADDRESPALRIMDEVARKGGVVSYHDPYVPSLCTEHGRRFSSVPLTAGELASADCVVITTDHTVFDPDMIASHARLVVDLRNMIRKPSDHVFKL